MASIRLVRHQRSFGRTSAIILLSLLSLLSVHWTAVSPLAFSEKAADELTDGAIVEDGEEDVHEGLIVDEKHKDLLGSCSVTLADDGVLFLQLKGVGSRKTLNGCAESIEYGLGGSASSNIVAIIDFSRSWGCTPWAVQDLSEFFQFLVDQARRFEVVAIVATGMLGKAGRTAISVAPSRVGKTFQFFTSVSEAEEELEQMGLL
eukprot:TRINITY_DN90861_c0_g1_i1.p1 TRINITY_DN90861_c0_g1~~TRINITY_DN90861_c0_g1_i1.p1  ORF type:complete len:204 (+),score=25.87 TRINITY_DN90861_c0_g1_i1:117-728(+)